MNGFSEREPTVIFIYFMAVSGVAMFCAAPSMLLLSLLGAIALFSLTARRGRAKAHLTMLLLLLIAGLINPLFSHKGDTVLFFINDTPITLESILYGFTASLMLVTVLYWFRSFSVIMTEDRLLHVFGRLSPRLALVLSMALRYVPLFGARMRETEQSQKGLGLYGDGNPIDTVRSAARVFSITTTWALEKGIITASSMDARGYGLNTRSFYKRYRFRLKDGILLSLILLALAGTVTGIAFGGADFDFYPQFTAPKLGAATLIAHISYGILAFLPAILETEERIRWKYLLSRI